MLSSIQSRYTVPINPAPPLRIRTISEPPAPKSWLAGNSAHSSPRFQYKLAREVNNAGSLSSATLKNRRPLEFARGDRQIPADSLADMPSSPSPSESEPDIYEINSQFHIINAPTRNKRENPAAISEEDSASQKRTLNETAPSDHSVADIPIHIKLAQLFEPFITPKNKGEIEELIMDRSDTLKHFGIGTEELTRRLKNANAVDNATADFLGMFSSLGFIVGTQAATSLAPIFKAYLAAGVLPYMPGAVVGIIDRLLNSVLTQTHVGFYDRGDPALFEQVMQENLARNQRSLKKEIEHQAGALTVAYELRNVLRSLLAPAAAHFGQKNLVDTVVDGLGGVLFSGRYAERLRREDDRRELLAHPAYLLSQENWIEQLDILQHGPLAKQRVQNLISRISRKVPDLPQTLFNACKGLFTLNSVTEISLLMIGFACNEWLKKSAGETFDKASPEASAFLENAVGTFGLGVLYYTLGASITFTTAMTKKMQGLQIKAAAEDEVAVEITSPVSIRNLLLAKATHVERYAPVHQ
jgi:hypothetical protein